MKSPEVRINTRPQLIARIAAGDSVRPGTGGDILVYLFETAGNPFFKLACDGGELPEGIDGKEYPTAKQALRTAADLALCVIYDEVDAITETGDEDECFDTDATA